MILRGDEMPKFTQAEIDAFILEEAPHHDGGLTREKAIQYMTQREANSFTVPAPKPPTAYEDAYGIERWADTGVHVTGAR